jgi:Leucine-rich repeat (LRR) protein
MVNYFNIRKLFSKALYIFLFVFAFSFFMYGQCDRQRDSLILVELYNSTKGPDWIRKNNWLVFGAPIQSWYGIVVDVNGCVSEVNLNSNRLDGPIPDQIINLTELVKLNVNDNRLTIGNTTDSLPNGWSNMKKLEILNLSSNILGGPVNAELGSLTNLRVLNLSLNFFSKKLPSALGNLQNVRQILLNQNEITGSIPASFGQMQNLEELILSQNVMSGSLPSQLGNLSNLRVFSITQNQFSGVIPAEFGNMKNVQFLYMNENQLSGNIPSTLGNLTNLRELWLNNNQLSGTIPAEIAQANKLRKLLLNDNQISGNLPTFLTTLTALNALHVSKNMMTGTIPASITDLANLESLLLDNNEFTGIIPENIGLLTKLTSFQIHNNQISGFLPESLGNIPNLKRIYFQNNKLQGCFPQNYRKFCSLKLSLNTNANGYNFLGNDNLLFQGDFDEWCSSNYFVNGEFTVNSPICEGNTLMFTAIAPNLNYKWEGPNGFTSTLRNPSIPNFTALLTGTYYLTVTDFGGCTGTSSQQIDIVGAGEIMVNSPLCEGKTIQFTISPGISYEWTGPGNFTSTLQNPAIPNAVKSMEGIYKVKIKTADCTIEKEIEVVLTQIGEITEPSPTCVGSDLTLEAKGGNIYRWTGPNNFTSTSPTPVITNVSSQNAGIYKVEIRDNTGCRSEFQVSVDFIQPVVPQIDDLGSICPEGALFLLDTNQGGYSGSWQGSGVIKQDNAYYFDPAGKNGEVELVFVTDPSFTCVSSAKTNIFVHSLFVNGKELSPNTAEDNSNGAFIITCTGSGNDFDISWDGPSQGSRSLSSANSFEINNIPAGQYTLTMTNDFGCIVTDTFFVRDFYATVLVPNIVIKNGSSGINNVFAIYGKNILSYDVDVYDRWGSLAFTGKNLSANDIAQGWDVSATHFQTGVYIVYITLKLPGGEETRIENLTILE